MAVACGFGILAAGEVRAADGADLAPVDVVEVSGLVDEIVADSIEDALVRAESNGAQAVILQVNTKGAVVGRDRMASLLGRIRDAEVPVAVWVGPSGSRALGVPAQMMAGADGT
ncbi:MAG: hypothetical protein ACKOQ7_01380, partial [Actinomycetota bacterium]